MAGPHLSGWHRLVLLLLALFGQGGSWAVLSQSGFENPVKFGPETGLGDGNITALAKDHLGFMWIATMDGLYRFDGSGMTTFKHDPNDPHSISDNLVTDIVFDSAGKHLWIATQMNGLNAMDVRTGRCRRYGYVTKNSVKIKPTFCHWVQVDRQERVWAGCDQGLIEIDPSDQNMRLHPYHLEIASRDTLLSSDIYATRIALEDHKNDALLWIGTATGLLAYNKKEERFLRFGNIGKTGYTIQGNNIRSLYQHTDGALYCGTYHAGVLRFDPSTRQFQSFPISGISSDWDLWKNVYHIAPKSPSELWITTLGGLAVLNTLTQSVTVFATNNLENNHFFGVRYIDDADRYWTWARNHFIMFNPLGAQFQQFKCPESIGGNKLIVQKIGEDTLTGTLYFAALYSTGLIALDRKTGRWSVLPPAPPYGLKKEVFYGRDLLRTRRGEWLVLTNETLYRVSADRKRLVRYPLQPPLDEAAYRCMIEDHRANLWIGSHYKGLIRLNTKDGTCRIFKAEFLTDNPKGNSVCWSVMEDTRRQIWFRRSGGYSVYQPDKDIFYNILPFGGVNKASVTHMAEDKTGRIWILGKAYGLGIADPLFPEHGVQKWLKSGESIKSYHSNNLLIDPKGAIWIGSENGLEWVSNDLLVTAFYPFDYGIAGPIESMTLLSSGEIALGHRGAVSIFHPDRLLHNKEKPRPYLTSFKIFQQEYLVDTLLPFLQTIHLAHNQNYFSIEFSAVGYNLPDQHTFEYQMQGADPDWINPGKRRYAAYTNLAGGDYIFMLRVANNEGVWCELPLRVQIHIATPWWDTWWAWCCYVVLIAGSIHRLYRIQLRRQLEHAENIRLKELDTVKTNLYTNITHEFRTPLTVIDGMAEQIRENPVRWLAEGTDTIRRNSQSLLRLVNQMLELRKLEAGMLPVYLAQGDIVAYLKYLLESFHSYAESKNIHLSAESRWDSFFMDYDAEKIRTIVSNLLSNAIKFTPGGGTVTLKIAASDASESPVADPKYIELMVRDTGIGIPPEDLPRIFDRFHQVEGTAGGSGIGLTLAKELTQLMGGHVRVESAPGQGACFTVTLPVSRRAAATQMQPAVREKNHPFITPVEPEGPDSAAAGAQCALVQIVEDNADVVRYLRACLEPEHRLMVSPDGRAGMEQAFAGIPDLIVSDVMMPGMDGFELCRRLKADERTNHIPIILLTARADTDSRLRGLQRGADAYLAKPFNKVELLLQIKNLLDGRQALQAHYLALATQQHTNTATESAPEENAFILKARTIVEAHIDDHTFNVELFCREIGMSNSNLHRKLTALTGRSANQFIRHIRLAKACTLLRDPERTVVSVAYDCGFNDPVYFARAFRQEFGMSPSEFRHIKDG